MKESIYDNMTRCEREVAELLKNMGIKWSYEHPVFIWDERSANFDYEYRRKIFDNNGYRVIFLHLYRETEKWKNHLNSYLERIIDYRYKKMKKILNLTFSN